MDSFGIDRLALPKFGIEVFRLPNFGQTSNGASKGRFHESLVDAWFMSGYKNDDAPSGIRGVKGNVITLHNFLFAGNSGFGKYNYNFIGKNSVNGIVNVTDSSVNVTFTDNKDSSNIYDWIFYYWRRLGFKGIKVKVQFTEGLDLNFSYFDGVSKNVIKLKQGINILPSQTYEYTGAEWDGIYTTNRIEGATVTITQIPDNEGALCFDGVDDYAVLQNTDFTVGTVILGYYDYDKTSARWKYFYDANVVRTYAGLNDSQDIMIGSNAVNKIDKDGAFVVNYTKGTNTLSTPLYIGTKTELTEFMGMFMKYFAVYSEPLTTEQIEEEKVKLENKWKSKLNKS